MQAILVKRADQLASSIDGSADISEHIAIVATAMAYETRRRPWARSLAARVRRLQL
jgi:hypothetical protein